MGFGFAGDFAGDFVVALDDWGFGEGLRPVPDPVSLEFPRAPFWDKLVKVPLLGRLGGGGESRPLLPSPSSADESTMGCLRAARGLPMPPEVWIRSEAKGHSRGAVQPREHAWEQTVGPLGRRRCTSSRRSGMIRSWRGGGWTLDIT